MYNLKILLVVFFVFNFSVNAQEIENNQNQPKTFVGKGLKEIDNVAKEAFDKVKDFIKNLFRYKNKKKYEKKINKHKQPDNYIYTNPIVTADRDTFFDFDIQKNRKPEIELRIMYPRISPGKGYFSFQIGDYNYKRYVSNITKDDIKSIRLISPNGDSCQVKKFRILPKRDVKRHFSFVLDHSGSMGNVRADMLQQGVYNAINYNNDIDVSNNSVYTIHKFDGEGNINHLITSKNLSQLYSSLVPPNGLNGYGKSTAIKDALFQAVNVISADTESEMKMIVLFTDGYSNTDEVKIPLSDVIRKAINNNINIVVVSFGSQYDENYLNAIAYYAGGNRYKVWHENEFSQLFENILADVNLSYEIEFSPCMFGDEIQIEMMADILEGNNLTSSTFFATPADQGSSIAVDILFDPGSDEIDEEKFAVELEQIVQYLNFKKELKILIEGHTDKTGSKKLNLKVSKERAESLKKVLTRMGVDESRIETKGLAWDFPAYPYLDHPEINELNRRIEIKIL